MIVADGLHKVFGELRAVDGVSFRARDGAITGLLGPNGAGKSTTLRMLSTILKPTRGRALVDDTDVAGDPDTVRRRIGVLPHDAGLYGRLTARENIAYFGRLHGLDGAALDARVNALIAALDVGEFAERRAKNFSHGQRTRVALARALVHSPANVLLDEPTNGLDVMATRALREFIRQLKADGHCVLFSSHVMQEVAALCDHIVIIAHGRVVADGTPAGLLEQTGATELEEAFVKAVGTTEGLE